MSATNINSSSLSDTPSSGTPTTTAVTAATNSTNQELEAQCMTPNNAVLKHHTGIHDENEQLFISKTKDDRHYQEKKRPERLLTTFLLYNESWLHQPSLVATSSKKNRSTQLHAANNGTSISIKNNDFEKAESKDNYKKIKLMSDITNTPITRKNESQKNMGRNEHTRSILSPVVGKQKQVSLLFDNVSPVALKSKSNNNSSCNFEADIAFLKSLCGFQNHQDEDGDEEEGIIQNEDDQNPSPVGVWMMNDRSDDDLLLSLRFPTLPNITLSTSSLLQKEKAPSDNPFLDQNTAPLLL